MTAPEVVVWTLDGRPHEGIDYGTRLVERLAEAGLRVEQVVQDERPPTDAELAAPVHVLSGGTTLATSGVPWLTAVRAALERPLRLAAQGDALVIGVCLGSQLLAERLFGPGATAPSLNGLEVGLGRVFSSSPGWMSYAAVPQFHYYEILAESVARHPDAEVVLTGDHSAVQAFTVGGHVLAMQFHPELTVDDVDRLIDHNAGLLEEFELRPGDVRGRVRQRAADWSPAPAQDLIVTPVRRFLADGGGPGRRA
ncbi:hypothetical protein QOZ88_19180 [Blastococcus sp. BMG 814]|uniref:Glutamine amidotransferase domain-containing protein n=1 Tax=Blastococcus carthaginiensis TaxID=3050034 RepID=A0ABT9IGQ8_9ACTN|nr:hypothetical protein [Blastococcus carthaginiensis]MDP5184763.1 hypothetical protein [Blastococcus carthaginiensis]